jgi:hypothetical protein
MRYLSTFISAEWSREEVSRFFFFKRDKVTRGSETYVLIGLFFFFFPRLAFGGMNVETQLTSPTESALRHECITHSYAHKGLSVWQERRFQLEATHNRHQDWKHLGQFKTRIPLYQTCINQNTIYSTLLSVQETRKLHIRAFHNICWVRKNDVNTCT